MLKQAYNPYNKLKVIVSKNPPLLPLYYTIDYSREEAREAIAIIL